MNPQQAARTVFVARQPIFRQGREACGYELLFRSGDADVYTGTDGSASTRDVIASSFVDIGLDELTGGLRGFINFPRDLLLDRVADILPPHLVAVEVLETVAPDDEVVAACRRLKDAGYVLALDDYVASDARHPLLDLADIVKVDFMATNREEQARLAALLSDRGVKPLAEKVETEADFQRAAADGYEYFQGYFFAKPTSHRGATVEGNQLAYLRLLEQVNRPDASLGEMESAIRQDVTLTYKLLRYINSVWFGLRHKVADIRQALVLLGPKEIRKWFALVSLRQMGTDKPDELLRRGILRARLGEGVAPLCGLKPRASELFLLGMFSIMDALLDVPMDAILGRLPLDEELKGALLGRQTPLSPAYDLVTSYECGQWDRFRDHAERLHVDAGSVPPIFSESVKWADQAFASVREA